MAEAILLNQERGIPKIPSPTTSDTGKALIVNSSGEYELDTPAAEITIDTDLSGTSTNPVQNKVINTALSGKADSSHNHSASNITSGTLGTARGGTGITSNPSMLTNLGSTTAASVFATSPRPGVTGTLPVANGGTGNSSVDTTPTSGSTKMVTSGGVYTALAKKSNNDHTHSYNDLNDKPEIPEAVTVDSELSDASTNPVQNKVIKAALDEKALAYTYGTEDLVDGESPLEAGKVYFVY